MVRVPLVALPKVNKYASTSFLQNTKVASQLADKLTYDYDSSKLSILDVYSGNLLFSNLLHNTFQPKQHLILESRVKFSKQIETHLESLKNDPMTQAMTMTLLDESPYSWTTYLDLTNPNTGILQPGVETRDHIHSKLLFCAYLAEEVLLMQWLACLGNQNWIQQFGNVRMLLWVPEASAIKVMARTGTTARHKCSLVRETFSTTRLLATVNTEKFKKGVFDDLTLDVGGTLVMDEGDFTNKPMSLLEINPKDHDIEDIYSWDYVTKNLMILRTKKVEESIRNLGPGASEYFTGKLSKTIMRKRPKDLAADEFVDITRAFDLWPFKPDNLFETMMDE